MKWLHVSGHPISCLNNENLCTCPLSRLKYKDSGKSSQMLFRGRNQDSASMRGLLWGLLLICLILLNTFETQGLCYGKTSPFSAFDSLGFCKRAQSIWVCCRAGSLQGSGGPQRKQNLSAWKVWRADDRCQDTFCRYLRSYLPSPTMLLQRTTSESSLCSPGPLTQCLAHGRGLIFLGRSVTF